MLYLHGTVCIYYVTSDFYENCRLSCAMLILANFLEVFVLLYEAVILYFSEYMQTAIICIFYKSNFIKNYICTNLHICACLKNFCLILIEYCGNSIGGRDVDCEFISKNF